MPPDTDPAPTTSTVVAGDFFTRDDHGVRLHVTVCLECEGRWFPPVAICSRCAGRNVVDIESGSTGVSYASTVVRIGPPEFPAPYVLSYVDIDGVRILAHARGEAAMAPGTDVQLTFGEIGNKNGMPILSYMVRPLPQPSSARTAGDQR
jgi:uncharacterized protein